MRSLLPLSKIIKFLFFLPILIHITSNGFAADDIWKKKENNQEENNQINNTEESETENIISSDTINKLKISINEDEIDEQTNKVVGLFDPEENNFNLGMWQETDGKEIKTIFKRIRKLKLSEFSEDLLFKILFTNAYAPTKNLSNEEFIGLKVDWLIENKKLQALENLILTNPSLGNQDHAIKFLVNESLSNADIKSACKKINSLEKSVENNFLEKFKIYCLINNNRKEEAQLVFDLLKERGFKEEFFEDKINYLLGLQDTTKQKILDDNLLNFYLSHITSNNFDYQPNDKTNRYIWRYMSSANLIKIDDFENEEKILTYEKAASENSFDKKELFSIYLRMPFSFNQMLNANEVYKNLSNYKARALIYQNILLSDDIEKKLRLSFLLKDLFAKDNLQNVYKDELSNILSNIEESEVPDDYAEIVSKNLRKNFTSNKKIKYENDILHRSKVIRHFLDDNDKLNRTEKDFKAVYKKIRKNKKYFISIMDIIVLESLVADGLSLPQELKIEELSSQLTIPKNLDDLVNQNQVGLVMLKIVEIIGEDKVSDLDPETIYFLSSILNKLKLKKIRNNILSEALPLRI